jgi:hypothetical protein
MCFQAVNQASNRSDDLLPSLRAEGYGEIIRGWPINFTKARHIHSCNTRSRTAKMHQKLSLLFSAVLHYNGALRSAGTLRQAKNEEIVLRRKPKTTKQ